MKKMIDPDEALRLVLDAAARLPPTDMNASDALGCVLAEDVAADRDYPPFHRAMMDGYAVRLADAGHSVQVAGEVAAGQTWPDEITPSTAIEIMTGAPCPAGAEAVVPREQIERSGATVRLPDNIRPQQNIADQASEARAAAIVLRAGTLITPLVIAILASVGRRTVQVFAQPRLGIISTGNELAGPDEHPGPARIRDSNGPMLAAMARQLGLTHIDLRHAADTPAAIADALTANAASEIVILTGGVSAGKHDIVPQMLEQFGARLVFHKVTQKPGKPMLFAVRENQLFFGLPGNPLACHLGFQRYVAAAIRKMTGRPLAPPPLTGRLTEPFRVKGPRVIFQLARADHTTDGWTLTPLRGQGSADLFAPATANALARFDPPDRTLPAGDPVPFDLLVQL